MNDKAAEQKFQALLQSILDVVLILNFKGQIIFVNDAGLNLLGFNKLEEVAGKLALSFIAPGYKLKVVRDQLMVLRGKEGFLSEYKVRNKQGTEFWVEGLGRKITYLGKPANLVSLRNITERKVGETRYQALFNNINSGVAVYEAADNGHDFILKDINRAVEKIEKVKKEDVIGKSVLKVFPGVKDLGLFSVFQKVWKTGKPEYFPVSFYKDERVAGWRDNYIYKLSSGEVVAIYEDVTERKKLEEDRNLRAEELEKTNKFLIGREMDMIELKKEVNALLQEQGRPPKYMIMPQPGEHAN